MNGFRWEQNPDKSPVQAWVRAKAEQGFYMSNNTIRRNAMFIIAVTAAFVLGLVLQRQVRSLARLKLRQLWLPFLAYLVQYGLDYLAGMGGREPWMGYVHLATYLLLFFWLYVNLPLPGMGLMALGTLLNFAVIALNQGLMPVTPGPLSQTALLSFTRGLSGTHGLLTPETRMPWLADVIYFSWPQRELDSIGDLVLAAGGFWLLFKGMDKKVNVSDDL